MVQREIRKRVKRLFEEVQNRANLGMPPDQGCYRDSAVTPVGEFARDIAAQSALLTAPRCPVGIQEGLAEVEHRVFGDAPVIPLHMGELISMVLADYRMEFIKRHAKLNPDDDEFPTMVVSLLKMRMLYAMGLRGQFAPVMYAGIRQTCSDPLTPARVMRRFLAGGTAGPLQYRSETVNFEAYTIDKMIELLQDAQVRGSSALRTLPPERRAGPKAPMEFIEDECVFKIRDASGEVQGMRAEDPVLGPALLHFYGEDVPPPAETYFENAPLIGIKATRAFWLYLLEKYGYIVKAR
jgi:hypothetical protein